MGSLRHQHRVWKVTVAMRDLEDPEEREITFFQELFDDDAAVLSIHYAVNKAAMKGVDEVLREHRKIMVGEE